MAALSAAGLALPAHRIAASELYPGWERTTLALRPSVLAALDERAVPEAPPPYYFADTTAATTCACCANTRASMLDYCRRQRPMGDLHMRHFSCDALVEAPNGAAAERWTATSACHHDCEARLAGLRAGKQDMLHYARHILGKVVPSNF